MTSTMTNLVNDTPSGRTAKKKLQTATATGDWRERMASARKELKGKVGQQKVIERVCDQNRALDRLIFAQRWHNAWHMRCADPEITQAVEEAAQYFQQQENPKPSRLKRQKLGPNQ